jgi:putative ATP-dependent endonuclease of the OLD family
MKLIEIQIENFRCVQNLTWKLNEGLNVLVGENDAGKTAIVDAIHLALGSVAQEQVSHIVEDDFRRGTTELRVTSKFGNLGEDTKRFIEYLTYEGDKEKKPYLYLSMQSEITENERWPINTRFLCGSPVTIKDAKAGKITLGANGGQFEFEARDYLKVTYLKPLRDAERELRARRGSRLSALINRLIKGKPQEEQKITNDIKDFEIKLRKHFSEYTARSDDPEKHGAVLKQLVNMLFDEEQSSTNVELGLASEQKLKSLLERLDLSFADGDSLINRGLGYSNLLFIAAELSLFDSGFRFLMIEEPEAHLHPQLQLKLAQHLNTLSDAQIILTTHSPNLASKFTLDTVTIVKGGDVFPLNESSTKISGDDKKFLERFLDVTRANLFFARGVLLVEGESEELLLPTIARLLKKDLTDGGVSIVKVGSKAAARYANVFLRKDGKNLNIPVAIITDKDAIPDAMTSVHPQYKKEDAGELAAINEGLVKTCVSDYWTFEYDLALGNGKGNDLACEMLQALYWLKERDGYQEKGKALHAKMLEYFNQDRAMVASQIMYIFEPKHTQKEHFDDLVRKGKPEMAQALATILETTKPADLEKKLPGYLITSIIHVMPVKPNPAVQKV